MDTTLVDFPTEILVHITASYCDVASVLKLGQTCKRFHAIASLKSVWASLVDRLVSRGLLDAFFVPNSLALSEAELIALVKRALHGPESWSPSADKDTFTPKALHSFVFEHHIPDYSTIQDIQIVSDGRHLLLNNEHRLECWDIRLNSKVWHTENDPTVLPLRDFAFEQQEVGLLNIILNYSPQDHELRYIKSLNFELIQLDLRGQTPERRQLRCFEIPGWDMALVSFCGRFAAFILNTTVDTPEARKLILVDIEKAGALVLQLADIYRPKFLVTLTTSALVMALETNTGDVHLLVVDLATKILARMTSVHQNSKLADIPEYPISATDAALTRTLAEPHSEGRMVLNGSLFVFPSPLSDQTYRIWTTTTKVIPGGSGKPTESTLRGFSLSYFLQSSTGPFEPFLTGFARLSRQAPRRFAFSGHGYKRFTVAPATFRIVHPGGATGKVELEDEGIDLAEGGYTLISSNSGNLVHIDETTIGSVYFE